MIYSDLLTERARSEKLAAQQRAEDKAADRRKLMREALLERNLRIERD
jgi:hypothetical protein